MGSLPHPKMPFLRIDHHPLVRRTRVQDFIESVSTELGMSQQTARTVIGGSLQILEREIDAGDFERLLRVLPHSRKLMRTAPEFASGGLRGFIGKAGTAVGGDAGLKLQALSLLSKTGLSLGQAKAFFGMFVDYLRRHADDDLINRIASQLPRFESQET
jgi:uncharacterized protein (DUF2267 family)